MRTLESPRPMTAAVPAPRPTPMGLLVSLAPSAAFLLVRPWTQVRTALVVTSLVAVAVVLGRRRRGTPIGVVLPLSLAILVLRTAVSLATGSETLYFGAGLATSALVAVAVGATAWIGTPLATHFIPLVAPYRHLDATHPLYRRVAAQVTGAWAVAELAVTALEGRHLLHATGTEFVLAKTTVGLPVMAVVVFFLVFYVRARLDPVEFHLAHQAAATPPVTR